MSILLFLLSKEEKLVFVNFVNLERKKVEVTLLTLIVTMNNLGQFVGLLARRSGHCSRSQAVKGSVHGCALLFFLKDPTKAAL